MYFAPASRVTPRCSYVAERTGEVRDSCASIDAARVLLGYEPVTSFEDGLAETVAFCRKSRDEGTG